MKISSLLCKAVMGTVCLGWLSASVESLQAEPVQYPQQTQYASAYYPPRAPTPMDRIRNAGQNVGDFIRRKFYGVNAPTSYPQAPVYQSPGGYRRQSYSLDAPAQPVERSSGTGFQRPEPETTPKYVRPPTPSVSEPEQEKAEDEPAHKSAKKTVAKSDGKSSASKSATKKASKTSAASFSAPTTSKKRYTPAKPSSISKSTPVSSPKRVEDEAPPVTKTQTDEPPLPPEPPKFQDEGAKASGTEARLSKEIYPLPGSEPSNTTEDKNIAPVTGRADGDSAARIEPAASTPPETSATTGTVGGTTTESGTKSSGSFLVGKKTSKAGRVVSPYPPYNELDITGLPSGSLALDPTTQKVFEVP